MHKKIDLLIIIINIFFFSYYAIQLIAFTDEFALNNLGFFNHAVAGLSEIIGIIFITFIISLLLIILRGINKQLPTFITIFVFQLLSSLNFWRYVITESPGETNFHIITINAIIFSLMALITAVLILKNYKKL